ncbi:IS66 family transposase zinc-finger binding domain-containing protein, partial [Magnetospirillum moscoviense]|uniref:IS66 family transposase n=1 Tax=Magnetospirillum moscoviense TaxID=1437059 RepID=UPI003CCBFA6D
MSARPASAANACARSSTTISPCPRMKAGISSQRRSVFSRPVIGARNRALYGPRAERTARLIDQMELRFEDLAATATEDEIAAEQAVAKTTNVVAFTRIRPARKPFPEHLPRERVVEPAPTTCTCCGSDRLRKLGEDVTETLEVIPRQWKVIQRV